MTTTLLLSYYEGLITSQHSDKPKFVATVETFCKMWLDLANQFIQLPLYFDLDTAVGEQLDIIGMWIGRTRNLEVPLHGVYFSFDEVGLGFEEGTWHGKYDPLNQYSALADDSYRNLLKIKARCNSWDGSNEEAELIWEEFCALYGLRGFVQDNQDMTMLLGTLDPISSAVARQLVVSGYIPLKPAGVRVHILIPSMVGPIFSLDLDDDQSKGFDTGAWAFVA